MSIREQLKNVLSTESKESIAGAINETATKANSAKAEASSALAALQSHDADKVKHITSAERTAWNAKIDQSALTAQKTELNALISTNTTNITGLRTDVNKNKTDIGSLTTKHDELSGKHTTLATNFSSLQTTVANNASSISAINNTLTKKEEKIIQSASAPASPVADQLWIDTSSTPSTMKRYNGLAWTAIGSVVDESKFVKTTGGAVTGTLNLNNTGGALVLPVGTNRYATT